jgi:probable DNA metabolism protein
MFTETILNFVDWRSKARQFILQDILPEKIIWQGTQHAQHNLLSGLDVALHDKPTRQIIIPKEFLALAEAVACHVNPKKWDMLYQALWRLTHSEKFLLQITSDPLVHALNLMQKAVRRDSHKMKAFVRFRCLKQDGDEFYIAWYKPDHNIARRVAPFFKRRFSVMKWTIMTPDETVSWDGEELAFSPGISSNASNIEDQIEELWLTYYSAIFNPARIKIKAMKNEMPVRFWHGLPEAAIIPKILNDAPARVEKMMIEQEGIMTSAADFLPERMSLAALSEAAAKCEGCPLFKCARQTVFGKGSETARLVIVGEQPGLEEDINGVPFVGPAGKVLRKALAAAEIRDEDIYVTNAVKHFKHEMVRGRQIHRSPTPHEVAACKPWVRSEIEVIQPQLVLCLGVTAAKALIKPGFAMKKDHGKWEVIDGGGFRIGATYHPSALLRAPTVEMREGLVKMFEQDLAVVAEMLYG